jgi:membrane-bound lytic murein transglycosylase B
MKRFVLVAALTVAANTAFATTTTPPISHHIPQNPTEKIHLRFSHQVAQIHKEEKLGKLTKAQAKTLLSNVEAIRKTEMADLKQNGTKTLTDAQEIQINSQLDALSKTIPIK